MTGFGAIPRPLRRVVLEAAYRLRLRLLRLTGLPTSGVKVMLFNQDGELLLIRNSYGRRDLWVFPGGGIARGEPAEAAARREVREEVGCEAANLRYLSTHLSADEGKRDTIHLFAADAVGAVVTDGVEVAEARFFPLDALPPSISDAALRRISEYRGEEEARGAW